MGCFGKTALSVLALRSCETKSWSGSAASEVNVGYLAYNAAAAAQGSTVPLHRRFEAAQAPEPEVQEPSAADLYKQYAQDAKAHGRAY